eukprot:Skav229689  [mRNA]  locus=scaffold3722:170989:179107:- [translate_table: standard]
MSVGILAVGLLTGMFLTSTDGLTIPKFEPLAAAGGAMWMLGNLMCPYIIQIIGLGLGLTMWDLSNMLVGWFIGHFGLLGVTKESTERPIWNYVGLILASVSLVFFSISSVMNDPESETQKNPKECLDGATEPCKPKSLLVIVLLMTFPAIHGNGRLPDNATIFQLLIGCGMAILAGSLFGTTFVLPTDLAQGDFGPLHSDVIMDYVFSHFIGIFLMAVFALVIYVAIRGKKSYTPRSLVLPAIWSGIIWGIAQARVLDVLGNQHRFLHVQLSPCWFDLQHQGTSKAQNGNSSKRSDVCYPTQPTDASMVEDALLVSSRSSLICWKALAPTDQPAPLELNSGDRSDPFQDAESIMEDGTEEEELQQLCKITKIMVDSRSMFEKLERHFIFNFTDDAQVAPVIYGGYASDGCIVGVISARVWT